jgi:hypothetical protein
LRSIARACFGPQCVYRATLDDTVSLPHAPVFSYYDAAKRDYTGIFGTGGSEQEGGFNQF